MWKFGILMAVLFGLLVGFVFIGEMNGGLPTTNDSSLSQQQREQEFIFQHQEEAYRQYLLNVGVQPEALYATPGMYVLVVSPWEVSIAVGARYQKFDVGQILGTSKQYKIFRGVTDQNVVQVYLNRHIIDAVDLSGVLMSGDSVYIWNKPPNSMPGNETPMYPYYGGLPAYYWNRTSGLVISIVRIDGTAVVPNR